MKNKEALVDCFTYMDSQNKPAPLPKVSVLRRSCDRVGTESEDHP